MTFPRFVNAVLTSDQPGGNASNVTHGFVRAANGTLTTFDIPGAQYLQVYAINPAGTLTGYYTTPTFHGFLRAPDGALTTIDVPGSAGTGGTAINPAGTVTGIFFDAAGVLHGFLFLSFQVIP